jgi:hypothetical protein
MPEVYIRGNSIKYLRIPDEVVDLVPEVEERESKPLYDAPFLCCNDFIWFFQVKLNSVVEEEADDITQDEESAVDVMNAVAVVLSVVAEVVIVAEEEIAVAEVIVVDGKVEIEMEVVPRKEEETQIEEEEEAKLKIIRI